jgi:predicted PurR-regulated permease PerM
VLTAKPDSIPSASHWSSIGIFLILSLGALVFAKTIAIPIASAILVALVLSPIRRGLNVLGLPSPFAAGIILITLSVILGLLAFVVSDALGRSITDLDQFLPDAIRKLEELTGLVQPVVQASEQIEAMTTDTGDVEEVVVRRDSILSLVAQGTPQFFGMLMLSATLAFFLLASGDMFYEKLVQVMPTLRDKAKAVAIARSIERHLSCYLLTITLINAGLGVAVGLAMWALGMPSPVLFGIAAFGLNYIPYLGALTGVGVTFLIGLLTFETVGVAFIPALVYWFLTSFEGQFLTPFLVGRRLKLNAVMVFLSLALWAWLWGFAGMILSTPMLIALKAFSDRIPSLSSLGVFLGQRETVSDADGLLLQRFIPYEESINTQADAA